MARRAMAALLVVGLGIGIWYVWPRRDQASPTTTSAGALTATTSTTPTSATNTEPTENSTTTVVESYVVESVEEAEAILRELWFGWFEGIYLQDEDRIREVVATEEQVEVASESFGITFESEPSPTEITFTDTELLRSDERCLAAWTTLTLSGFRDGATQNVHVIRWNGSRWLILSSWKFREDLWEADCDSLLSQ